MEILDALLMILKSSPNGIGGKTAIQKIAYFVSIELGLEMNFFPHYYGPYSRTVSKTLQALCDFDFVDDEVILTSNNRSMHCYKLNNDGEKIIDSIIQEYPTYYEKIKEIVDKINPFMKDNYYVLSWAAKIYYILDESEKPITEEEIIKLAERHDWKLTSSEIESAKKLLLSLGLVEINEP